ncbi:hypothetical protein MRX96_030180 [Rhipicephalus microplus]
MDRTTRDSGDGIGLRVARFHEPLLPGDSLVKACRLVAAAVRSSFRYSRMVAVAKSMQALSLHANVGKDFVLMPYVFTFPLYDEDLAKVLNYAGLGSQALGELFLAAYRSSSPPAREPVLEFTQCVLPDAQNARQDESQVMQHASQVLSFNVLFDAYRARAEAGDKRLPGLDALTLPPDAVRGRLLRRLSRRRPAFAGDLHSRSAGSLARERAPLRRHVAADEPIRAHFRLRPRHAHEHRRQHVQTVSLTACDFSLLPSAALVEWGVMTLGM